MGRDQKTQKLTYWKPAFSISKQNSSHLQDFCNAFLIKDRVKYLNQSQGPAYLFASNLDPGASFCYKMKANFFFFNFSGDKIESQGVFVAKNITISTFPQ